MESTKVEAVAGEGKAVTSERSSFGISCGNLPGREWTSASRESATRLAESPGKLDGDEWCRQEALATNVGTED